MTWNRRKPDQPYFAWGKVRLVKAEEQCPLVAGISVGTVKHLRPDDHEQLTVEAMRTEGLTTSEIAGDIFDRASVQSSIRKQLGVATDKRRMKPAQQVITGMMVDLYRRFVGPRSNETFFAWHHRLVDGK